MIQLAIGVFFVYLVLSLICTAVNESVSTLLNKRGKNLYEGVKNLLNDPRFTGLAQQVYNHGLVDSLSRDAMNHKRVNRPPSYMPSRTFSLALLDVLGSQGVVAASTVVAHADAETAYREYQDARANEGADDSATEAKEVAFKACETALAAAVSAGQKKYESVRAAVGPAAPDPERASFGAKAVADVEAVANAKVVTDAKAIADTKAIADAKAEWDTAKAALKVFEARLAAIASAKEPKNALSVDEASKKLQEALAAGRDLAAQIGNPLDNIQATVKQLPDGHTKESLLVLIAESRRNAASAGAALDCFRANVETWFDDAMDRVSGWYRRWTQWFLLLYAAIFVVALNVDTVVLVRQLSTDKELRDTVTALATKVAAVPNADSLRESIDLTGIPLGWTSGPEDLRCFPWPAVAEGPNYCARVLAAAILKLFGLVISIGAVSLGAPFWFGMLGKVINIRGAGVPPVSHLDGGASDSKT